jgi:hypothetical protein
MVFTERPDTSDNWTWHENARSPSMWIMQAPQSPAPQPNFVPVSFTCSRITQSSGVAAGASIVTEVPFTLNVTAIAILPLPSMLAAL